MLLLRRQPVNQGIIKQTWLKIHLANFTNSARTTTTTKQEHVNSNPNPDSETDSYPDPDLENDNKLKQKLQLQKLSMKPETLKSRVERLVERKKFEVAVNEVRLAPFRSLTHITWMIVISGCFNEGSFSLGHSIWVDMKRRGFKPTAHSYTTYFSSLSKAKAPLSSFILEKAQDVYEEWIGFTEQNPTESGIYPTNAYLYLLGKSGQTSKMLQVFEQLPVHGRCAANVQTYTTIFAGLSAAAEGLPGIKSPSPYSDEYVTDSFAIWTDLIDNPEKRIKIDTSLFCAVVQCWMKTDDYTKRQRALGFIKRMLHDPKPPKHFRANTRELEVVLRFLSRSRTEDVLLLDWFDEFRNRAHLSKHITFLHCEIALKKMALLQRDSDAEELILWQLEQNKLKLAPTMACFEYALQACNANLNSERALKLASIILQEGIQDEKVKSLVINSQYLLPSRDKVSSKACTILLEIGLSSNNLDHLNQILKFVESTNWLPIPNFKQDVLGIKDDNVVKFKNEEMSTVKHEKFWYPKLTKLTYNAIDKLLKQQNFAMFSKEQLTSYKENVKVQFKEFEKVQDELGSVFIRPRSKSNFNSKPKSKTTNATATKMKTKTKSNLYSNSTQSISNVNSVQATQSPSAPSHPSPSPPPLTTPKPENPWKDIWERRSRL